MKTSNIILLGIAFIVIIAIGAIAGSGGTTSRKTNKICKIDVAPKVISTMFEYIKVTNKNYPKATFYYEYTDLPEEFPFRKGDVLSFEVKCISGYQLNSWRFVDRPYSSANPYEQSYDDSFTIILWVMLNITATP